jgi:2-dehydro-3-deoxygalactonokinase
MRGEELQMLGWLVQQESPPQKQLFALPGTHNKWTLIEDGVISNFLTAFTGELFGLLRNHSILITDQSNIAFDEDVFMSGVQSIENMAEAQLIHTLFSTRSKQVLGEVASTSALSYLSGMIIGADVKGACPLFGDVDGVTIIGEASLRKKYELTLQHFGVKSHGCKPADIAISGFESIYQHLNTHAN